MLSPNMFSSIVVVLALIVLLTILGKRVEKLDPKKPIKGPIFLAILGIMKLNDLISTYYGAHWKRYAPILTGILIYLAFANTASLIGLSTPLSNINIALTFSFIAFMIIQTFGLIVRTPAKRFKDLASPSILLFPINLIGELSTPLAMGLRLFGNLLSGAVITIIIFYILPLGVNLIPLAFVVHPIFNIGFGLIQAFVYFMLLTIFLSMALEAAEVE